MAPEIDRSLPAIPDLHANAVPSGKSAVALLASRVQADGVGFEVVSVTSCNHSHLRHDGWEGEAKGEAVCPPALSGDSVATATAERLGSSMEAEAIPSEVAELAAVWHRLPDAVRAGIVAMVRASGG
jgi:hypothetical protein